MKHQRLRRKEEIKEFFDKMSREEFIRSLEETEFDYYKNIKDPLFRVPRDLATSWSRGSMNFKSEFPCSLSSWRVAAVWVHGSENWHFRQSDVKLSSDEIKEEGYAKAA